MHFIHFMNTFSRIENSCTNWAEYLVFCMLGKLKITAQIFRVLLKRGIFKSGHFQVLMLSLQILHFCYVFSCTAKYFIIRVFK
ncbi:hypothetical protein BKA93DRAFT_500958 [Sparassis latifolia]